MLKRDLSRRQTLIAFMGAGWLFVMVIFVGGDMYSYGGLPTLGDFVMYVGLATLMAPVGALTIALKGGWLQEYVGWGRVFAFLLVVVVIGVVIAAIR